MGGRGSSGKRKSGGGGGGGGGSSVQKAMDEAMSASIGTRGSKVTKVLDDAPVGTTVFDGTTTITDTQTKSWGETATATK